MVEGKRTPNDLKSYLSVIRSQSENNIDRILLKNNLLWQHQAQNRKMGKITSDETMTGQWKKREIDKKGTVK